MNRIEELKTAVATGDVDTINAAKAKLNIMDGSMIPDSLLRAMNVALGVTCVIGAPVEDIKSNHDFKVMVDTDADGVVDAVDSDNDGVADEDDFAPLDPEVQTDPNA